MALSITSISPTLGVTSKATTVEITGTDFTSNTKVQMVFPIDPPTIYDFSASLISNTKLQITVGVDSLPLGIYDVKVVDGTKSATLSQAYRSHPDISTNPFATETTDAIISRMIARIPEKYDVRQGNTVWDLISPIAVEIEKYYKRLNDVLLQGFGQYMVGGLLDLRAEEHGVIRKAAAKSKGFVKITAAASTIIPTLAKFSTVVAANSKDKSVEFTSLETISLTYKAPVTGTATSATTTSLTDTTKSFTTDEWKDLYIRITGGKGIGQIRKVSSNTATLVNISKSWDPNGTPDVTSTYELGTYVEVQADVEGKKGNVAVNTITKMTTPIAGATAVTNPTITSGGTDKETDAELVSRFLLEVRRPSSAGNVSDYKKWAKETPGVSIGEVGVLPLDPSAGNVKVVIINSDGTLPDSSVISTVQSYIDPSPQQSGGGKAPIGALVTVVAATNRLIEVAVSVTVATGYNAAEVRSAVKKALEDYINSLPIGQVMKFVHAVNIVHDVNGVDDYNFTATTYGWKTTGDPNFVNTNITPTSSQKPKANIVTVT